MLIFFLLVKAIISLYSQFGCLGFLVHAFKMMNQNQSWQFSPCPCFFSLIHLIYLCHWHVLLLLKNHLDIITNRCCIIIFINWRKIENMDELWRMNAFTFFINRIVVVLAWNSSKDFHFVKLHRLSSLYNILENGLEFCSILENVSRW